MRASRASALVVGVGLGLGLGLGWQRPVATPLGCAHVFADGACAPDEHDPLRLYVDAPAECQVSLYSGLTRLTSKDAGGRGVLLEVPASPATLRLLTVMRCGWRFGATTVKLRPLSQLPWLRESQKLWDANKNAQAEALLRSHLTEDLSAAARSEMLGRLARLVRETGHLVEAEQFYRQALVEDRRAGLPSDEAKDVFSLASVLAERRAIPRDALALLLEHRGAVEKVPSLQPWFLLNEALYHELQGDFVTALPLVDQGLDLALRFDDKEALGPLSSLHAELLETVGRLEEAEHELQVGAQAQASPCLWANSLSAWGRMRLRGWEARWPDSPVPAADPRPPLIDAEQLRSSSCTQQGEIATDRTALARAAWLAGDLANARRWLAAARSLPESQSEEELTLEWQELDAALALAGGDAAAAQRGYQALLAALRKRGSKPGHVGFPELRYRAQVGLARALESSDATSALAAYQEVEELLEHWALEIPGWGRGGFLGRYQGGTSLYLDLLARTNHIAEAFELFRHVRTRALRAMWRAAQVSRLGAAEGQAFEVALAPYRELRAELESLPTTTLLPADELDTLLLRRRRLREQMTVAMDEAQATLGMAASREFTAPDRGEGLLGCHPVLKGWLCFLAERDGVELSRVARLDGDPQAQAQALLVPFAKSLEQLRQLKVLGYGELHEVDVHALPYRGRPLGEQLAVRYALDLPTAVAAPSVPAGSRGHATVFLGQLALRASVKPQWTAAATNAAAALTRWGWDVTTVSLQEQNPDVPGSQGMQALRTALGRADLLHYLGVGEQRQANGQAMLLPQENQGLSVEELLGMRVPRYVILIGCQTGRSTQPSGGLEGLGLAQAFLLRGSQWVIATQRQVPIEHSARFSAALHAQDVTAASDPSAVIARLADAGAAFRVYVP